MHWMPRLRVLLARRPWIYWLFVAAVGAAIAVSVAFAMADVRRARQAWGDTTTVFVATDAISAGDDVRAAVETREFPTAVTPSAAVAELPSTATAIQRISAGEIVVEADLAAVSGPLALLPDGWLAITIEGPPSSGSPGTRAVVLADGAMLAPEAVVIAVTDDGLLVGVPATVAAAVAEVAAQRLAVVALAG